MKGCQVKHQKLNKFSTRDFTIKVIRILMVKSLINTTPPGHTIKKSKNKTGGKVMERIRAAEIIDSLGVIAVTYQEQDVWIENIKNETMAEVSLLTTHEHVTVPLEKLEEK
jgi:H-type small acid-soluble spore protein